MKILLINQHTGNRGDEAACRALLRRLINENEVEKIYILYNIDGINDNLQFTIHNEKVVHLDFAAKGLINNANNFQKTVLLITPVCLLKKIYKNTDLYREMDIISQCNVIISAPGGVNIGTYKEWAYLWRIFISLKMKKKVAVYSPSIGPFPRSKLFTPLAIYSLKKVQFLSLRDIASQKYAKKKGIKYIKSIDTAFADRHIIELPNELNHLTSQNYVVIVPNQLYNWHPEFMRFDRNLLDRFYVEILDNFTKQKIKVVLLPHLFGFKQEEEYFTFLKNHFPERMELIEIINSDYNSDIQQAIIKHSIYLVGGRYHSIIFALKNNIPFSCFSYEHKMSALLDFLKFSDLNINAHDLSLENINQLIEKINNNYVDRKNILSALVEANNMATRLADQTYAAFREVIFKNSN